MRKAAGVLPVLILVFTSISFGQSEATIKRKDFFKDERPLQMTLTTDIKELLSEKKDLNYVNAVVDCAFPDSTKIKEQIRVRPRGLFRKKNCYLASLQLDFKNESSPLLSPLKKLKMVGGCGKGSGDEQLLLREYLIYKMYNLITDKSFKVRLLYVTYNDNQDKVKPYSQYAFLIEDVDEMAKRNQCQEKEGPNFQQEFTVRDDMTVLAIFQFMVGNTDWSVPGQHNIKLMVPKSDTNTFPIAVPFDFDFAGLVNAPYAVPPEFLGITKVTERVYRGFPRTPEEIKKALAIFLEKEADIKKLITNSELLNDRSKKETSAYIDQFYELIKNDKRVQSVFIDNARKR